MPPKSKTVTVDNPKDPKCWCREAAARMEKEAYAEALYCYEQAVRFYPKDDTKKDTADVWYNIGCLYEKTGHRDAAAGCFTACAKKFLTDYRFYAELSRILALTGKTEEALKAADEALIINPYSSPVHANKAGYLLMAKKPGEALAEAEEAIRIDSTSVLGYLHKANALVLLGKASDAARFLEESKDKLSDEPRVLQAFATVYLQAQEYENARDAAERYAALCAGDDKAWSLKGAAHAYLGEKEAAECAFRTAAKINPKDKSHKANLAAVKKL
ncbi:MAG TPA: tetratricopeptide repeat protein [Methanocorpusculum sp.]|nr:tetratricopeptide repeat protein [Methanocorpusculum sp.]